MANSRSNKEGEKMIMERSQLSRKNGIPTGQNRQTVTETDTELLETKTDTT